MQLQHIVSATCVGANVFAGVICTHEEAEFLLSLLGDAAGFTTYSTPQGLSLCLLEVHVYLNILLMTYRGFTKGCVPNMVSIK